MGLDLPGQVRAGEQAAAEHHILTLGLFSAAEIVRQGPYLAIGDYRYFQLGFDIGDVMPVGGWLVAVGFGARVHGKFIGTGGLYRMGIVQVAASILVAQADFGGDGNILGHRIAHGFDNVVHTVGAAQQAGAALVGVDGFGGAAKVQIYGFG